MSKSMDPQFLDTFQSAFHEGDEKLANKPEEAENVRRVEEVFRSIARKDFAALSAILADDVTLEIIGSSDIPMAGMTRGRQMVIEAVRNNFAQLDEQRPEIHSVVAQGNTVVVIGRDQGLFRPTGRRYDLHCMYQYTFKNNKVISIRELFDTAAMLRATRPEND
jgi:ketosteroid isomerase-like protein